MASTVRVDDEGKRRIQRLQDAWHRARGERPTQGELVAEAMAYLERHREAFLAEAAWTPLSEEEIERWRSFKVASGDTGAYDVDEVVYG